jgi:hypothetical protein
MDLFIIIRKPLPISQNSDSKSKTNKDLLHIPNKTDVQKFSSEKINK